MMCNLGDPMSLCNPVYLLVTYFICVSLLQGSFAKETYNFKEPTNRSHPIPNFYLQTYFICLSACDISFYLLPLIHLSLLLLGFQYTHTHTHTHTHAHTTNIYASSCFILYYILSLITSWVVILHLELFHLLHLELFMLHLELFHITLWVVYVTLWVVSSITSWVVYVTSWVVSYYIVSCLCYIVSCFILHCELFRLYLFQLILHLTSNPPP